MRCVGDNAFNGEFDFLFGFFLIEYVLSDHGGELLLNLLLFLLEEAHQNQIYFGFEVFHQFIGPLF